jgi:ribonuclease P protein component
MLPKKIRALSSLIDAVFKKGQRSSSLAFDLLYTKSDTTYSLFAVSVAKKAAKTSVERHKLRRICYDIMGKIKLNKPYVCVLVIKKAITKTELLGLKNTLEELFNKAKLTSLS